MTEKIIIAEVEKEALEQIHKEDFEQAVVKMKEKIRKKKSFRDIFFPWEIKILRKDECDD